MRNSMRVVLAVLPVFLVFSGVQAQEAVRQVTLEEALGLAERNNPNLEQSASSVEIAGYQELTAIGSFLPSLSLSYGYS
ncbi:MAG: TolC family protein, partial [Gemmatimonadota bacterium]